MVFYAAASLISIIAVCIAGRNCFCVKRIKSAQTHGPVGQVDSLHVSLVAFVPATGLE